MTPETFRYYGRIVIVILGIAMILFLLPDAIKRALSAPVFIAQVEAALGVRPGEIKTWLPCQCTVKYLGTTQHGDKYDIHVEVLD